MSKIIHPNGNESNFFPRDGREFELDELREAIGGGFIELVNITKDRYMVIDEDGIAKNLPVNAVASFLATESRRETTVIRGDALIADRSMIR